ncbi:hypothetical protein V496_02440 [Pseudogymnoascus sp. VKM F-4515 (FW-2607)]|nr:hypothetical protein V496_02440 [Pseudogymnoascus sp. VKM F-4515 (FW-2607)]KFY86762.1 hypothetical protein V498_07398 [Pseudogymnoascus sp. VKM F-4517 (FW-2822)]
MTVLPIQKQGGDGEFRPISSPNAAPPFKRPRGRPRKDRSRLAHEICVPAIISTPKPIDEKVDESIQSITVLRPPSRNLRAMRSAGRADYTAFGDVVQKLPPVTKRKRNRDHTKDNQAEVTLEGIEQQRPRYIICLKTALQAVESPQPSKVAIDFEDGDSDSVSEVMTYYTDTGSETELTTYSSVVNAAVKAGGEFDGTTSRNGEAHETAHPIDTNTSLDQSPADVEFSHTTEDANANRQAHTVEENSNLTDERGQIRVLEISDEPEVFGFGEMETQQTRTMVSSSPGITQVPGHPEKANINDHVRGLSQPLETIQSSEQSQPFDTTEVTQKAQGLLWTPLIQPSEQGNTVNEIGDEETLYMPSSIAVCMSYDANMVEEFSRQKNVAPAASIAKELKQLYPPGSFMLTHDPHSATNAFIATALSSLLDEADPLQSPSELPSNRQRPGTAISILTDNPPPFLEPRCSPSPPTMMLPLIAISLPTHARAPSTLLSPQSQPLSASLSSHASRQDTMGGNPQTSLHSPGIGRRLPTGPSWKPHASFQRDLTSSLVYGRDDTIIAPAQEVRFLYRRDLITLVPHVKHLGDKIINEYLHCLTHYTNAQNSRNITLIGSMDPVARDLLKKLARFSTILVPIKVDTHWLLAVLYPEHGRPKGQVKVYDSHPNWTKKVITASNVLQFLESRLGREFNPAHWILISRQFSQPQQNDADSGLYVLANAKSIALSLGMVHLDSNAQRMDLRWQIAQELVTRSIGGGF